MDQHPARIGRVAYLEQQIERLLQLADELGTVNPAAVVAARSKAADLRADLDRLRAYEADRATDRTPLEEARAMRQRADAAGSHVAARDLFKVELDLIGKAEAKRLAEEQEALANLTEAQIAQMLLDQLQALPVEVRERLLSTFAAGIH